MTRVIEKRIVYMLHCTGISQLLNLVKKANSILYGFIWNRKDKVKRQALISDLKKGGLKMIDIESIINAQRVAT